MRNAHARQQMLRLDFQLLPLPKKRQLATRQNTEQCNVHWDRNVGSPAPSAGHDCRLLWPLGALLLLVVIRGDYQSPHNTLQPLCFLSSATVSSALLPSHQMYFPDEQVLLRCIFRWTPGLKISLVLHLCSWNDMQGLGIVSPLLSEAARSSKIFTCRD